MAVHIPKKQWRDLSTRQRVGIVLLAATQMTLLVAALLDIHRRSAEQINGSKRLWTAAVFVNFVGPIAYFVYGRKR